jgi:hypothetical protein
VLLSHLDGCGPVTIDVTARSGELVSTTSTALDVICFHQLVADFDQLDWHDLVAGAQSVVTGDLDPSTSSHPTISNHGNVPMGVSTTFQPLCLESNSSMCIGQFGLEVTVESTDFVGTHEGTTRTEPSAARTELVDPAVALCPGDVASLDFVVAAPASITGGDYSGSMRLVGIGAEQIECDLPADEPEPVQETVPPTAPTTSAATNAG